MARDQGERGGGLLYRTLTGVAGAALRPFASLSRGVLAERMALSGDFPSGVVWIHGASVGELNSARLLIEELARDLPVLVTANSQTGRALVASWGLPTRLAPLDLPGAVARFLEQSRPILAVTIENEIWPNRARALAARGIPQVVIGARMSARSAARWQKLPGLIRPVLSQIDLLSAQDPATEARLMGLGLRPEALAARLNLKLLGPAQIIPGPRSPQRARTVLAASTHVGEDGLMIAAYLAARAAQPDLRLILAPRHPQRGDSVAGLLEAAGIGFARRSGGGDLSAQVLLADTLGEMGRWYEAASICITGGSFSDHGGHTPWEPAAHACAVIHGPHIENFAEDYARLDAAKASIATTSEGLAPALCGLLADPVQVEAMGQKARLCLDASAGEPGPLLAQIRGMVARRLAAGEARPDIRSEGE